MGFQEVMADRLPWRFPGMQLRTAPNSDKMAETQASVFSRKVLLATSVYD